MLSLVELSAGELDMLRLMADFFADKPKIIAGLESYTSANYALISTYSEHFQLPEETARNLLERLREKVNACRYVQIDVSCTQEE